MNKNILIVVLVVIILVLGGFMVYTLVNKQDKPSEVLPSNNIMDDVNNASASKEAEKAPSSELVPNNETKSSKQIVEELVLDKIDEMEKDLIKLAGKEEGIKLQSKRIDSVEIKSEKDGKIVADVSYSVKPIVLNNETEAWWCIGNGEVSGEWVTKFQIFTIEKQNNTYIITDVVTG